MKTTKKTSISLNYYYIDIIKKELETGRYISMNQVVMAGLRLLEKDEYESETKRSIRIKKQVTEKKRKVNIIENSK